MPISNSFYMVKLSIKSSVIFLSSLLVFACGSEDSVPESEPVNEFIGSWMMTCHRGITSIMTFKSESYISDFKKYENQNCTGHIEIEDVIETPIAYGGIVTTDSGVEATAVDYFYNNSGVDYTRLGLLYSDGDYLYFNLNTGDDVRPTAINFDVYAIKISNQDSQEILSAYSYYADEIIGTWISPCVKDETGKYGVKTTNKTLLFGHNYSVEKYLKRYTDDNCKNQIESYGYSGVYVFGDTAMTITNLEVKQIDLAYSDGVSLEQIIRIEQGYLYFGIETEDTSRPTEIDFDFWYEKQM